MDAECECRLGFLALGRWCKAMVLGKQLAVYCLDVAAAVIAVSSLVCLISIAIVAYVSDSDIATWMMVSRLAVLSPPKKQWDTGRPHDWSKERQLHLCNLWQPVDSEDLSSDKCSWRSAWSAWPQTHTYVHTCTFLWGHSRWLAFVAVFTKKTGESSNSSFMPAPVATLANARCSYLV